MTGVFSKIIIYNATTSANTRQEVSRESLGLRVDTLTPRAYELLLTRTRAWGGTGNGRERKVWLV